MIRRALRLCALFVTFGIVGACQFTGVNNTPLPFTKGNGSGSYNLTVYLENATNLVPNSEVKVDDVTVGSVRRIEFDDWSAKLTLGIEKGVRLGTLTTAKIGQKSLLGAEYLQLDPAGAEGPELGDDDVIPIARTSRYPETEEVLAALGSVLSGGGLSQIQTITRELNRALGGREGDVRSLIDQVGTFAATLDQQRGQIVDALESLDRLGGTFAAQRATVDRALVTIPRGIRVLRLQRADLTRALDTVAQFGDATTRLIRRSKADLVANLHNLQPVLSHLADAGKSLTRALSDVSFPFPIEASQIVFRGDYINFFATIDLTFPTLERDWLAGTPLDGLYSALTGAVASGPAAEAGDPLRDPVKPAPPASPTNPLQGLTGGLLGGNPKPGAVPPTGTPAPTTGPQNPLSDLLSGLLGGNRSSS